MNADSAWRAFGRALIDPFRLGWIVLASAVPFVVLNVVVLVSLQTQDVSWLLGDTVGPAGFFSFYARNHFFLEIITVGLPVTLAACAMLERVGLTLDSHFKCNTEVIEERLGGCFKAKAFSGC